MNLVLYYAPISCALIPYITLTEAGADFEAQPINLKAKQQMSADYLRLNPKHKVPVLVVDGKALTENLAIQLWIARNFPGAHLLPDDPWDEAQVVSLLAWCTSGLHPLLSRLIAPGKVNDIAEANDSVRRIATDQLFENFQIADDLLADREFLAGSFTGVDAYFFWLIRRSKQLDLDISQFVNCEAHFERMTGRASVQKLLAYEKEVQAAFAAAA